MEEELKEAAPITVKELGLVKQAKAILLDPSRGSHRSQWAERILAEHQEDVAAGRSKK